MSRAGILPSMEVEGAVEGDAFFRLLGTLPWPLPARAGDVGPVDNLSTHKSARMPSAIQVHGAEVIFLPRGSPRAHPPIEGAWSKLKACLRKVAPRAPRRRDGRALARGLARITATNACGWFGHAGFTTA